MSTTPSRAPTPDAHGLRLALAVARFHPEITDAMRRAARGRAEARGATVVAEATVAGSYDLPLVVQELLRRPDVDAVVALGAIVTGETKHDEAIAESCFHALIQLSLTARKPVGLGVTGPGQTYAQAQARVDRASAAVDAVVESCQALASAAASDAPRSPERRTAVESIVKQFRT